MGTARGRAYSTCCVEKCSLYVYYFRTVSGLFTKFIYFIPYGPNNNRPNNNNTLYLYSNTFHTENAAQTLKVLHIKNKHHDCFTKKRRKAVTTIQCNYKPRSCKKCVHSSKINQLISTLWALREEVPSAVVELTATAARFIYRAPIHFRSP